MPTGRTSGCRPRGLPGTDLLPRERITAAAAAALADPAVVQYGETAGLRRLRDVVAAHEAKRLGRPLDGGDVVITSGSQQALDLVARATLDPGDAVVVEDPVYVGALQVFQAAGALLHPCRSTPTGWTSGRSPRCWPTACGPGSCTRSAAFTTPRGHVEDDPYGLLAFDGVPPVPVAAHGDRVVRLGSTSKILAPALRVGRLTGPVEVTTAVRDVFDGAVTCSTPTGGMFCWLEFTDGTRTAELLPAALAHGVGFVPGSAFAPAAGPLDHAARLCFASRPAPVLRDAAHRLAAAWREAPPAAT